MSESVKVGVLSLHNSKETKSILNTIDDMGHQAVWLRKENIEAVSDTGELTVKPEVDIVVNRLMLSNNQRPSEELGLAYMYDSLCPVLNSPSAVARSIHKFSASAEMASQGVPIPRSVLALGGNRLEGIKSNVTPPKPEDETESDEAVHKLPIGTHGDETVKVESGEMVPELTTSSQGILQQLIQNPHTRHNDVRVYVVNNEVIGAMRRYAPDEDWRTNVARGGDVEDVTDILDDDVYEIAINAAESLGLDYAGIDLVEGKRQWYVLEANPTAGFKGFFEATSINPAPYIAKIAIERVGGTVPDDVFRDHLSRLDDSVPDAHPGLEPTPNPDRDRIGYVENVQVNGQTGSDVVAAKADTGATRTSIDTELAGKIGAGPIKDVASVKSGMSGSGTTRPLVDVVIRIGEHTHNVTVNIEDRSHMEHPVLIGRDILDYYNVVVREEFLTQDSTINSKEE